jgi:hypothetical protein
MSSTLSLCRTSRRDTTLQVSVVVVRDTLLRISSLSLPPYRLWVGGLSRTRKRTLPRWCIGARSNPLVPTGYTPLVSPKAVRGEGVRVIHCGARSKPGEGRLLQWPNVRVIPRI